MIDVEKSPLPMDKVCFLDVLGIYMFAACVYTYIYTPLKLNMEPENRSLEKDIPIGNHHFQVPC